MGREKIVAGNWKMNMNHKGASDLLHGIVAKVSGISGTKAIVAPPALYLSEFAPLIENHDNLSIAAQNVSAFENGAYTGEISADMLASINAEYCIVGHSERRALFKESNEAINHKIARLLQVGVIPILCIGETLEERDKGIYTAVLAAQLKEALNGFSEEQLLDIIIAYEPVWAIGTGKTASPQIAQETHAFVRSSLANLYSNSFANKTRILYGGSCNPKNAKELFSCSDIDGGLIGGASLNADDFNALLIAAQ